ncbi:AAA ATPase domain-containing protein [Marinobacter sp. es.042]|uniref:AAA family ATPase n=1 Tax=Marinobacter sp. es.042 TaxID=1761794 RepID=UPI000B50E6A2|nr:AAA family ATPase [Marinobacter sp. es.042]SNB54140.1 AAA ATPase domain-containing protein [Marinobacter sp. es.042]
MELHGVLPSIESLKIFNLHGERDITLTMTEGVKILVGDNGSGKTTVLHCLYSLLSMNFHKLSKIEFDSIELRFSSGDSLTIDSEEVSSGSYLEVVDHPAIDDFTSVISPDDLVSLLKLSDTESYIRVSRHPAFLRLTRKSHHSSRDIYHRLRHVVRRSRPSLNAGLDKLDEKKELIKKNFPFPVYYLPTYRRVEEDLKNLGYFDEDFESKEQLIQFGMSDVKHRFDRIRNELRESAVSLYTNLNGKMLTQLTTDFQATEEQFSKIFNTEALRIVLARVGDSISSEVKDRILLLIENKAIKQERYHPLVFVLSNLIDVYDEQKEMDDSIKEFVKVANSYLVDKKFLYDENKVEIKIINKRNDSSVGLEKLSSGEKQLVSIFSKLYLEQSEKYAVIFDEPELSLSIEWQETLLTDILKSNKCSFLLAATHSPFVFDNELDDLTGSLKIEYKEGE